MPGGKREQNYLSGRLQRGLLVQVAQYWLAFIGLIWLGMYVLDVFVFHFTVAKGGGAELLWEIYSRFCRNNVHLLICILVISPIFFWKLLWLTHRVAGPLERFRDALERLERGERVEPITTRRDDLLVEYQYAFNRYLASLRQNPDPHEEGDADVIENPLLKELNGIQIEIQHFAADLPPHDNELSNL